MKLYHHDIKKKKKKKKINILTQTEAENINVSYVPFASVSVKVVRRPDDTNGHRAPPPAVVTVKSKFPPTKNKHRFRIIYTAINVYEFHVSPPSHGTYPSTSFSSSSSKGGPSWSPPLRSSTENI